MTSAEGEQSWYRVQGLSLIAGSVLAGACNLALPRESDDGRSILRIAASDSWPWLHAGLILAVLLVLFGFQGLVALVRDREPTLASAGAGALVIGGTLILSALATAGVALRKLADNFVVADTADHSASFFAALGAERLAYALYAVAGVVLLGVVPAMLGAALWRRGGHALLSAAGVVAGALGFVAGFVQLNAEVDTSTIYLVASLAVTLWSLAVGVMLWRVPRPAATG